MAQDSAANDDEEVSVQHQDVEYRHQLLGITESLQSLTWLIKHDAEKPDRVRSYVEQAEERIDALRETVHSMQPASDRLAES